MTIKELKELITAEKVTSFSCYIFECPENYFLANQYLNSIAELLDLSKNYISTVKSLLNPTFALLNEDSTVLNILFTDKFEERLRNDEAQNLKNTIIVCKEVDKTLKNELVDFIISFPKLINWQIKDYISYKCPGLSKSSIEWLYEVTKGNIYKIEAETSKLALFQTERQEEILSELRYEEHSALYNLDIFKLVDAVITQDKFTLLDYFAHKDICDFEPLQILYAILQKAKKILLINYNNSQAELVGISGKEANGIKYYYKNVDLKYLYKIITQLSPVDEKIKTGQLDLNKSQLIDYIICKVLN